MATYQAPFQRDAISEVVPRALELSSLSKSSLLTGRRRIRVIPQTGQTYGSATGNGVVGSGEPTLANILVQDSAGLLDMQSVVLSMNVRVQSRAASTAANAIARSGAALTDVVTNPYAASLGALGAGFGGGLGTNTALPAPAAVGGPYVDAAPVDVLNFTDANDPIVTAVMDDFAWSAFRRIQISLNSQLVDDLDYCGRRATTEVYASASPAWYDTIGTVMGGWKLTNKEFVQPLIVTPASSTAGGGLVSVATFPIKSRVSAHQWANYVPHTVIQGPTVAVVGAVGTLANANVVSAVALQAGAAANPPYVPPGGAIGQLQAIGQHVNDAGGVLPLAISPVALGSKFVAPVSRTDVLNKLYGTSAFMRGVFWGGSNATGLPLPPVASLANLATNEYDPVLPLSGWKTKSAGPKFSIPLGLLSWLFRQEQLFPLRNAGQLILQIQFADALECCYAGFLNPVARNAAGDLTKFTEPGAVTLGYVVENLELECDIVTAIPEYTAILDSICSRPADKGLAIAFDSHLTSLQQVTGAGSSGYGRPTAAPGQSSTYTLIASKGSENVRSFHWTFSPTNGIRSPFYLQNSTFPAYNIKQWQIRVGSVYYPAFPSQGLSKNYMEMLSSVNAPMPSVGQASLINYDMYRASTPSYTWYLQTPSPAPAAGTLNSYRYQPDAGVFSDMSNTSMNGTTLQIDPATSFMADAYIGGYCFDNLKHAEALSHDGLDTRAIAGGMIQLDFQCEPLENFAVIFHIRFTRTIVLAENGVSIVG